MAVLTRDLAEQLVAEQGTDLVIPDIYTSIESYAFQDLGLTSVIIPSGINSIGHRSFSNNQLTSVVIPDTVTYIGGGAFFINDLTHLEIPDGVQTIGGGVLCNNSNDISITIPEHPKFDRDFFDDQESECVYNVNIRHNPPTDITLLSAHQDQDTHTLYENENAYFILSTTDTTLEDEFTYQLIPGEGDDDNNLFVVSNHSDGITIGLINAPNFEEKSSYSIRLQTQDSTGLTFEKSFIINVVDANDPPHEINISTLSFDENIPISAVVATLSTEDEDPNDEHKYTFYSSDYYSDDASWFGILGNELRVIKSPDFESKSIYNLDITSTDTAGESVTKSFTFNVNDLNEAPTDLTASTSNFFVNTLDGTFIASLDTLDPDSEDSHTYSLVTGSGDTDNHAFAIDGNQLKITDTKDIRTKNSYSIRLQTQDSNGLTFEKEINLEKTSNPLTKEIANLLLLEQGVNIIIPDNYSSIDSGAFSNMPITSIVIPESVTSIGSSAFSNNQLASLTIPDSVTEIGERAFSNNRLTSLTIPDSVTEIGYNSFSSNQLSSVVIPDSITEIGQWFNNNPLLAEVEIGANVNKIGDRAFYGHKLSNIIIPDSVTEIGDYAFYSNELENLELGQNIRRIGNRAFEYNNLKNVDIPSSVELIGTDVFDYNQIEWIRVRSKFILDDSIFPSGVEIIRLPDSYPNPAPTPAPVPTPTSEPTPTPEPTPSEEDGVDQIESIDDITTQDEVSTLQLTEAISIGNQVIETVFIGTKKKDKITGTSASEVLAGQEGKDVLKGGDEADGFFFNAPNGFGKKEVDKIKDFDAEEGDSVLVDKDVFGLGNKVKLKVVSGKKQSKKAAKSKKDFVYDDKKGLLYFNENGEEKGWGDGGLFAKLQGAPELDVSDFTIV